MISYLRGQIIFRGDNFIILEVNNVGYKVFLSERSVAKLPEGAEAKNPLKIFTYLHLREETQELYGFLELEELNLFETLNGISGIGPKTALALSGFGSLKNLKQTMENQPEIFHRKIKGIGQKKTQKILLEITGQIKELKKEAPLPKDEALDALISLGFPSAKAKAALSQVAGQEKDTDKRIKGALKILGSR